MVFYQRRPRFRLLVFLTLPSPSNTCCVAGCLSWVLNTMSCVLIYFFSFKSIIKKPWAIVTWLGCHRFDFPTGHNWKKKITTPSRSTEPKLSTRIKWMIMTMSPTKWWWVFKTWVLASYSQYIYRCRKGLFMSSGHFHCAFILFEVCPLIIYNSAYVPH